MKKFSILLSSAILLLGVLAGCSKVNANQNYGTDGQSINARVGDTFTIQLKTNPTTGYDWVYSDTNGTVQLLEKTYVADSTDVIGSGGTDYFKFKAQARGNATLVFDYERPWEATSIQQLAFSLSVN
jgi:inhibitor of cysteine peptidase